MNLDQNVITSVHESSKLSYELTYISLFTSPKYQINNKEARMPYQKVILKTQFCQWRAIISCLLLLAYFILEYFVSPVLVTLTSETPTLFVGFHLTIKRLPSKYLYCHCDVTVLLLPSSMEVLRQCSYVILR
jgi:hypothetical protein